MTSLILASSSQPRKKLLERLQIPFECVSPDIDETPLPNEKPEDMVLRLALQKAKTVAKSFPNSLIIGADQVGVIENTILCKPQSYQHAQLQLQSVSGQQVKFLIGLCLLDACDDTNQLVLESYKVVFRKLTNSMIENYLNKEQALNCAGSFKVEGLGIALVEKLLGDDYTALIGLPLVRLMTLLGNVGVNII